MNAPRACQRCLHVHEGACALWGSGGREAAVEELLRSVELALLPDVDPLSETNYEIMRARASVLRGIFERYPDRAHLAKSIEAYVEKLREVDLHDVRVRTRRATP